MDKPEPLPTDVDELTALVRTLQAQVAERTQFIDQLLEQIRLARHQHFGTRSERFSIDQIPVPFDNHDDSSEIDDSDEPVSTPPVKPITQGQRRSRSRRLPPELPRIEVVHQLDETDQHCSECQSERTVIGTKIREQLDICPATVRVIRHIQQTQVLPSL